MTNGNNGLLDGIRQIPARLRALDITGGLPGAPLGFRLRGATSSGPPASGTWKAGDQAPDRNGTTWTCITGGTGQAAAWSGSLTGLAPSGDATGATDYRNIQGLLNLTGKAVLQPGVFTVNATLQIPAYAALLGSAPAEGGSGTIIRMAAGANLAAIAASAGWTASSNTFSVPPCYVRGITLDGNSSAQGGGAGHGLVLQTYWSYVEDCLFENTLGDGLRLDATGADGSTAISNTMPENRFTRCQLRSNGGNGILVHDPSDNTATDGWITDCVVASPGLCGIWVDSGAGWHIQGNHVYGGIPQDGITVGHLYMTKIVENYIEAWGQSATLGAYGAIDLGYGLGHGTNDGGNGSVIAGNVIKQDVAPGNASSTIYGIGTFCLSSGTFNATVSGNTLSAPAAQPASAVAIVLQNQSGSSVSNIAIGTNLINGSWGAGILSVIAAGGTVNLANATPVDLMAGTTSFAPLNFTSGTLLTAAAAGAVEYDGVAGYLTNETTSGRGLIPVEQKFRLTATGGTISTIANYFGTTSNISLVSGAEYEIEVDCWFLRSTSDPVVWTFTNSAAPTSMNLEYKFSAATGIVSTAAATSLFGDQYNITSATATVTTGSLTTAVNHHHKFWIRLINGTGTSLKIQATASTAGTITPGIGSSWKARRVPAANIGSFAA